MKQRWSGRSCPSHNRRNAFRVACRQLDERDLLILGDRERAFVLQQASLEVLAESETGQ